MGYTRDEVVQKAKELAKMIAETEEVDFFKRAEAAINENENVRTTIDRIKSLQKHAVNLEHFQKTEALKKVEADINALHDELDSLPIVNQFKQSQIEVNELLQLVTSTISNKVTEEIIESTGGDKLSGETGSQLAASKGCGGCK
ncbi:MAG: RicAFT regulatory complex protein RicA family protein [Bacillaceae bacterium]